MMTNLSTSYLNTLCCPLLSIKWYRFDPKTKEGKELEHPKNVKNVSMHEENDMKNNKKKQKKTSILVIFNILQYYFQCPQLSWCCF
jgi:hypothetical protein